jgi:hypothetical protein
MAGKQSWHPTPETEGAIIARQVSVFSSMSVSSDGLIIEQLGKLRTTQIV